MKVSIESLNAFNLLYYVLRQRQPIGRPTGDRVLRTDDFGP